MEDLLSYELRDFLMFSSDTYWRMIGQIGADYWRIKVIGAVLLLGALGVFVKTRKAALLYATLALVWASTGYIFFLKNYAEIMLAAPYLSAIFFAGALLYAGLSYAAEESAERQPNWWGMVFIAYGLIGHTLVTSGGNLDGAGYGGFGITPDETALTTLGVLLLIRAPRVYFLLPLLWCTMGALTLYAMTAPISE